MTVEFAVGIIATLIVLTATSWVVLLVGIKVSAGDTAGAVARQLARGDTTAAREAENAGPADAVYLVSTGEGLVRVVVRVDAAPVAGLPNYPLSATAEALLEPGVAGDGIR